MVSICCSRGQVPARRSASSRSWGRRRTLARPSSRGLAAAARRHVEVLRHGEVGEDRGLRARSRCRRAPPVRRPARDVAALPENATRGRRRQPHDAADGRGLPTPFRPSRHTHSPASTASDTPKRRGEPVGGVDVPQLEDHGAARQVDALHRGVRRTRRRALGDDVPLMEDGDFCAIAKTTPCRAREEQVRPRSRVIRSMSAMVSWSGRRHPRGGLVEQQELGSLASAIPSSSCFWPPCERKPLTSCALSRARSRSGSRPSRRGRTGRPWSRGSARGGDGRGMPPGHSGRRSAAGRCSCAGMTVRPPAGRLVRGRPVMSRPFSTTDPESGGGGR